MKTTPKQLQVVRSAPNSAYELIAPYFLFHSNKLEGSIFITEEELRKLMESSIVSGEYALDDVIETKNSIDVFSRVVDTLGQPFANESLIEFNALLLKGTSSDRLGYIGHFKQIPNRIRNSSVQVALPDEAPTMVHDLLAWREASEKDLGAICHFHVRFEHIHPFQDGNGRIGCFIILKQCIENNVDIVAIDEEYEKPHKAWLEIAQSEGIEKLLLDVFGNAQRLFERKMEEKGIAPLTPSAETARKILWAEKSTSRTAALRHNASYKTKHFSFDVDIF